MRGLVRKFLTDDRGAAAVEFAFIAPVLAALMLGVFDLGRMTYDRTDLHSAVRSGAQYFMAGGDDVEAAILVIEQSWSSRPEMSQVTVEKCCKCAGVDAPCGQLCDDGSVPDIVHELQATAYFAGLFGQYEVSVNEFVRTR
ncbi:TadE/TadG family type IV pilus assembly protein [Maricaulis sp.]|uniref:TadE/TadG family type IV pilus assembly protein n=1 Tax=Maricaulis sp. TaxID=1486257 RepID=UPI00261A3054|nr:TadE/TadG family type IV pilus assembly protein [Maricaulis sp.]